MAPHRAYELIVKIGADTKEDLVREIENFANRIARDDITHGVIGGYASGAIYSYVHDGEQTHHAYFQQLQAELEKSATADKA